MLKRGGKHYDPIDPEDWEGQYDNGLFGEIEDEDRGDLETIDYVRTAYEEIRLLESERCSGVQQII